jgi:hypothetical protein
LANGILFSQMIPSPGDVDRFNAWYETDHIPARMVLPHFVGATRFAPANDATPDYLAVYEVDDLAAFETSGYLELKRSPSEETTIMLDRVSGFTRYISEEIGDSGASDSRAATRFLSVVAFAVPESDEAEFNAWYATEHVPMLLAADDWLRVRRYKVVDGIGGPWTHLAMHELASLEVMDSPERARARKGPLRDELVTRPWFSNSDRRLYRTVSQHHAEHELVGGRAKGED